eukprot:jgi/Tetstr1/427752/TSEL_017872.t2
MASPAASPRGWESRSREGYRSSEARIAQILEEVAAPGGRSHQWRPRGGNAGTSEGNPYSRSSLQSCQAPQQGALPPEKRYSGAQWAATSSRSAVESKRAADLAIRKMELESMMRTVKEMEQRVADERRARTEGSAAGVALKGNYTRQAAAHSVAAIPTQESSEAAEFDKIIRSGAQKIRDVSQSGAPLSLRSLYGSAGQHTAAAAAPTRAAPPQSAAERALTRAMQEVAKHKGFLTAGKLAGEEQVAVGVREAGPRHSERAQPDAPWREATASELDVEVPIRTSAEPSNRELSALRCKLDKEMAQRVAVQETGSTLQVELLRCQAQINQLTKELAESEKKRQMVEGRTSVQMDKAEASQKALRAELNKLKETANATQASQMEAESKKVKYLQSELEKLEKELHRERGVREMAERRASELDSQLSRMNVMLGRSEQGCEESLRGRELLQQEVNRLKEELGAERNAHQMELAKQAAEQRQSVRALEAKLEDQAAEMQLQREHVERRSREMIREREREIELKKAEVSGLRESLKEQSTMIASLKRRVEEHAQALKAPATSSPSGSGNPPVGRTKLDANVAKLTSEISELRSRASRGERAVKEAQAQAAEWRGKAEKQAKRLAELEAKSTVASYTSKSEEAQRGGATVTRLLNELEEEKAQREAERQRLSEQHRRELDKLESESSRVRHDTEMLRVTYEAQLEAEKASAQGRLVSLDAELRSRDARLSSMRQEYDGKVATLEDTVLQTSALVKRKEKEVAELREKLQASEAVAAEQRGQLAALHTSGTIEQESFKARVSASAGELSSLKRRLQEREVELHEANTKLAEMQQNSGDSLATRDALLSEMRTKVAKQDEHIAGLEAQQADVQRQLAEKKCEVSEMQGQMSVYKRSVSERDERLEQLTVELAASQRAASSTAELLSGEKSKLEVSMTTAVATHKERVLELERAKTAADKEWSARLASAEAALQAARQEVDVRDARLKQLAFELQGSEERAAELQAQMSRDASKAEALQETLQAAVSLGAAQVAEGEGLAGQLKAKVAALEADVQAKEMRVAELQGDVNALSSKLASAAEELKGRVEGLAAKEGELSEAVQKSRSLQEELQETQEKLAIVENEAQGKEEALTSLTVKLEEKQGESQALLERVLQREAELSEATSKAEQLQQEVEQLTNTLEQREFELAGVEQELANVTAEASAERGMLEDELQEAQAVAEDWQQRVAELEGRFGELQQELAESRARSANSRETMLEHETRKLRAEVKQKAEQLEALHVDMESWSLEREDHQRVVAQLEADLEACSIERRQLEQELLATVAGGENPEAVQAMEAEMEAMRLENQETREQVIFLETELKSAQDEMKTLAGEAEAARALADKTRKAAAIAAARARSPFSADPVGAPDDKSAEQLQAELAAIKQERDELKQRVLTAPSPSVTPRAASRLGAVRVTSTPGSAQQKELLEEGQSPSSWLRSTSMLSTSLTSAQPFLPSRQHSSEGGR